MSIESLGARARPQPDYSWTLPPPPTPARLGYPTFPAAPRHLHTWETHDQCRIVFRWWNHVRAHKSFPEARHFRGRYDTASWAPAVLAGVKTLEEQGISVVDWIRHTQALPSAPKRNLLGTFAPGLIKSLQDWVRRQYPRPGGGERIVAGPAYQDYVTCWHQAVSRVRCCQDPFTIQSMWARERAGLETFGIEREAQQQRALVSRHLETGEWIWPFTAAGME